MTHRCTGWWAPSVLSAPSLPVPPLGAALLYFREVLLSPQHMVSKVAMFLHDSSPQSLVDWSTGVLCPSPGQLAAATRMYWTETWPLFPVVSILRGKAWEASEAEFPVCSRSFHREQEEERIDRKLRRVQVAGSHHQTQAFAALPVEVAYLSMTLERQYIALFKFKFFP